MNPGLILLENRLKSDLQINHKASCLNAMKTCLNYKNTKYIMKQIASLGTVVHTLDLNAQNVEAGGSSWIQDQPGWAASETLLKKKTHT